LLIVRKYGGTSVADVQNIISAASNIAKTYSDGNRLVIVVSAQGDTTDELLAKAAEISGDAGKREIDALISTGEQQSAALMAIALRTQGLPSVSLNAAQSGINATSVYGNARIKSVDPERLRFELERGNTAVVAGFQGMNKYGDVVTIGRGGSDTTAVALAVALNAELCEICTDVDGVYTADPRIVKNARKIRVISYDEMLELSSLGAKVLHNRSVEMAKRYRVPLIVRSSFSDAEGTLVKDVPYMERMYVSGVTVDKEIAGVTLLGVKDKPGGAYNVFSLIAREGVSVGVITRTAGAGSGDISFTVARSELGKVLGALEENKGVIHYTDLKYDDRAAKISVVGAGMESTPGVASGVFEALYAVDIGVKMISTSEIKITILVDERDAEAAVNAIHDRFFAMGTQDAEKR
jgi:aspartate kinase